MGPINQNINEKLATSNRQLQGLMMITEAINENASISHLFSIYKNALAEHYQPGTTTLCINTQDGMKLFSTDTNKTWKQYRSCYKQFSKKKSKFLQSQNGEVFIPVYHKKELIALVHLEEMWPGSKEELNFLKTITNFVAIAIENKRLFKQKIEQEGYKTQMSLARQIQLSLMPHYFSDTRELEFKTLYIPHSEIGGDYFDFFHIKNSNISIFCIADVAGKGIPAALLMANLQASLRRLSINYSDLISLLQGLNLAVFETTKGDRFITVFLAAYDVVKNEMKYVNAGHNYPIIQTQSKGTRFLKEGTIPLGIINVLPDISIGIEKITEETVIFSYTDGLEELKNGRGQMLGQQNILSTLHDIPFGKLDRITENIEGFIEKFKENEPIGDDITVLLCKIKPDGID